MSVVVQLAEIHGMFSSLNGVIMPMKKLTKCRKTNDLFAYAEDNVKPSFVYKATNTITGDFYIGLTRQQLNRRVNAHFHFAEAGDKRQCPYFYRAIRKYGRSAFVFEIIAERPTYKEAALEEMRLIAELKPKYNVSPGGDGILGIGQRASAETRARMSRDRKGRPGYWKGKKRPRETYEKVVATRRANGGYVGHWTGKKRSQDTVDKIVATKAKYRKYVHCLTDGRLFHGLRQAAEAYGIEKHRSIADCCIGRRSTLRGLQFQYVQEAV